MHESKRGRLLRAAEGPARVDRGPQARREELVAGPHDGSRLGEPLLELDRQGRAHVESAPARRMPQLEARRVQHQAYSGLPIVQLVTRDGPSRGRELHPKLVRSTGLGAKLEQRARAVAAKDAVARHGE